MIVRGIIDERFLENCLKNKKDNYKNKKIKIMYSGGLDKERGIEVLLESLNYINYDFELIISGKGELKKIFYLKMIKE
ncbi:hypothetical protein R2R32_02725 [Clostridium perfringens]|nr:hypothetical protein [Clostridium perfringens]